MSVSRPTSQKSLQSDTVSPSVNDTTVVQTITKNNNDVPQSSDEDVIEKIKGQKGRLQRTRRLTRQRINVLGRSVEVYYPSLSGFANKNDRFPTVA